MRAKRLTKLAPTRLLRVAPADTFLSSGLPCVLASVEEVLSLPALTHSAHLTQGTFSDLGPGHGSESVLISMYLDGEKNASVR